MLFVVAMAAARDVSQSLASERSSIESTYELTKYLEYQLKEIKDIYVSVYRGINRSSNQVLQTGS